MHDNFILFLVLGITLLLAIANISHFITKKIGFPYSIFLVIIGSVIHFLKPEIHLLDNFSLTPELLFFVFLPPLLFESAFHLNFRRLKKDAIIISLFATLGVVITTFIIALGVHFLLGVPIWISLLFGSVVASTDPIAVIAIFKEMGAPNRLLQLVDAESMMNDGTSIILSRLILSFMSFGFASSSIVWTGPNFLFVFLGGAAFGSLVAFLGSYLIKQLKDEIFIEVTISFLIAFLSFIIAEEYLKVSGVVSTVTAGIVLGNFGIQRFSPRIKTFVNEIWEYIAFVANSLVFLLVGITFGVELLIYNYMAIIIAFILMLIARTVSVYLIGYMYNKSKLCHDKIPTKWLHIINWGGLRGSLPIAIILSLPSEITENTQLLNLTVGVVLLSLLVNGLSIKSLIKFLKIDQPSILEQAHSEITKTLLLHRSRKHIGYLTNYKKAFSLDHKVDKDYKSKIGKIFSNLEKISKENQETVKKAMYQMAFHIEREVFIKLHEKNIITEKILIKLKEKLDEGLDLIEAGIYPKEFSKNKVMIALSAKSKKGFDLKELFLYRKARELANLEVLEQFSIFEEVPVLASTYKEIVKTYNDFIKKNRQMCNDLISGNPKQIEQYENDLCYTEFVAMEESILHDLEEKGSLTKGTLKTLHQVVG
jgi:CPA1 family monovalent cation:H+ antiporter